MPPLRQKYGLSEHGAALLKWIVGLRPEDYLATLTPVVEDHLKLDIGIKTDWPEENIPAYLAMLVEEINEKTEFGLLLQPWRKHGDLETRIRVKKKPSEMDSVLRAIQFNGLSRNKVLDSGRIKEAIDALLCNE